MITINITDHLSLMEIEALILHTSLKTLPHKEFYVYKDFFIKEVNSIKLKCKKLFLKIQKMISKNKDFTEIYFNLP